MAITAAGNTGTPLWRKLGLAPGRRRFLRMAPPAFDERFASTPAGFARLAGPADFDISFGDAATRTELDRSLQLLHPHLRADGVRW